MSAKTCPLCGGEAEIVKAKGLVPEDWAFCNRCDIDAPMSVWNRRTPGPATEVMLMETIMALREGWAETIINQGTMEDFLREWGKEVPS